MKSLNGRVMDFLSDYTGALNDRLFKFLRAQGLTGALPDMMRKMGIKKLADILGLTLGETRDILNFNGTQYATLSEPVVFDGDFEIEWVGVRYVTDTSTTESIDTLFAGAELNNNTVAVDVFEDRLRMFAYSSSGNLYPSLQATIEETSSFSDGKIQRLRVTYVSGVISLYLNDAMILTETWNIAGSVSVGVVGARTDTGARRMSGNVFSFRVWKDGDRTTGELVTDLRFDEPDTNYQRNYASPIADENDPDWSGAILQNTLPGDWEEVTQASGQTDWLGENVLSEDNFITGFQQTGPNTWIKLSETTSGLRWDAKLKTGYSYQFKGATLWKDPSSPLGANISANFAGTNKSVKEVQEHLFSAVAGSENQMEFRINVESSAKIEIRVDHVKRILQYAEGALIEPASQVDLQHQVSFENFFQTNNPSVTVPDVATVDATTLTLSETTGTLGDPMVNTYATKLSGITEPVYFEIRVNATQGQAAWDDFEPFFGIGCDFEKFIHFAAGDSSAQNYGGFVLSSITKATQLYADGGETFLFSDIRYPEDENLAAAGWVRVGVRYDPSTREIWLHVFYENTVDISFRTATGPFQTGSNANATVAEPYTVTTVTNASDSSDDELCITLSANRYYYGAGDTTFEILTQESDFLLPGGVPSGYTALHNVTGTATSEYDLGDYFPYL